MNIAILCGGSGNRIDWLAMPKALYPLGDSCALTRLIAQLPRYPISNILLATGYHTYLVAESAPHIPYLDTWNEIDKPGLVWAIRQVLRYTNWDDIKIILGDTVWSDWDLGSFLTCDLAPIILAHDDQEDRYAETYGLSMDAEGIDIFEKLVDSCDYMLPLNQEIAFAGTERVPVQKARIGHFERAIDFSTSYGEKKKRLITPRVMDFDTETSYNQVQARLALRWFDD